MKTFCIIILILSNFLTVFCAIAAVMNYLSWKREHKQNIENLINWNEFIIDNFENPVTKQTIEKRNILLRNILDENNKGTNKQ